MRDFLIVIIVLGLVPPTLVRPQIGILAWFWLSLMNPHRLAWGYAQQFRVALVTGAATLLGWSLSQERKVPPNTPIIYVLAVFTVWVSLSALFAIHPDVSIPKWTEIIKILLMTFVTTCIVQSRERIIQLVSVIAFSLGVYGIKGGLFAIATGGHYRVFGPEGTFIEDNNCLALALIMILPLLYYLRTIATKFWLRNALLAAMILNVVAVLASYSRGALVGLVVTLGFFWIKSRHRIVTLVAATCLIGAALHFLPPEWFQRMGTIEHYQQDQSAKGRFDSWKFAFRLAEDHPLFGGGQLIYDDSRLYFHYVPDALSARAAHSIYFEVLGESGFGGLALFLLLLMTTFVTAGRIVRMTRNRTDLAWARNLTAMLQVSITGYAVSGAFLSLGFFDLYYALIAVVSVTQVVVRRELATKPSEASTPPPPRHDVLLTEAPPLMPASVRG